MEVESIEYKEFLERLHLSDDKIALLLYDLYKYKVVDDKKDELQQEIKHE